MTAPRSISSVVCLGCGCACDDVTVTIQNDTISDAVPTCPVGRAWFGNGAVPSAVLSNGNPTSLEDAIRDAAEFLTAAHGRLLVHIGPDLTSEVQRAALVLADVLGATVDSATSDTAAAGLVTAQRRGRATATLGEVRNRADFLVFWGVDPNTAYPRFLSRYALNPIGTHVPAGRAGRTVASVSLGADRGPAEADVAVTLTADEEIAALSVMRAIVLGRAVGELPLALQPVAQLAARLMDAKYAVFVHDAEPSAEPRDPLRVEGLIALTQALNGPARAALISLRAGGNRSGAEAVLTWQTGYPFAVDYAGGFPRYTPLNRGLTRFAAGELAAALLVGSTAEISSEALAAAGRVPTVVIGPRASEAAFTPRIAIDTGVAGVHEGGTAYRMDEVPLPLRPLLPNPRAAAATLVTLLHAVLARQGQMA